MNTHVSIDFLGYFLKLFGANIKHYSLDNGEIKGVLEWEDENDDEFRVEEFRWEHQPLSSNELIYLKELCEFILQKNLIRGDKISVSEEILTKKLVENDWNWEIAKNTIENLLDVGVQIIEDNKEANLLYLHL